jgi:hypothetical protein
MSSAPEPPRNGERIAVSILKGISENKLGHLFKSTYQPGAVAHACNPSYSIRRIKFQGQPWQNVSKTPISTNKQDVVVHGYNPSHARVIDRRITA